MLISHRLLAFWIVFSRNFHLLHIIISSLTLIPLYILGVSGMYCSLQDRRSRALYFMVSIILSYWVFHVFTEVDYDWRYRLPVLPFLLLFASYAATLVLRNKYFKTHAGLVIRYGIVGLVSTTVDYFVLNVLLLMAHVSLFWSAFFGFIAGGATGYVLHSRWTFQYDTKRRQLVKLSQVLLVSAGGLAVTEIVIHALTYGLDWHHNVAKAVAVVLSAVWAFSALRWWVFPARFFSQNQKDIVANRKQ